MTSNYSEYTGVTTNSNSSYSTLQQYSSNGNYVSIISPTPTTMEPEIFSILKPHDIEQNTRKKYSNCSRCVNLCRK
jgi:hypothetical protein